MDKTLNSNSIFPEDDDFQKFITQPIITQPTIEIYEKRYDELLAKEEKLRLLENALKNTNNFEIDTVKLAFGIEGDADHDK